MQRRASVKNLMMVMIVAVAIALAYKIPEQAKSEMPSNEKAFQEFFEAANEFTENKRFEHAEHSLLEACKVSLTFPAGDRRLAEALDDLGLVMFSQGRVEDAVRCQGEAVAALLLSCGPEEPDVQLFFERYLYAFSQKEGGVAPRSPEQLLHYGLNLGLSSERFHLEVGRLLSEYEAMENLVGVAASQELMARWPTPD